MAAVYLIAVIEDAVFRQMDPIAGKFAMIEPQF